MIFRFILSISSIPYCSFALIAVDAFIYMLVAERKLFIKSNSTIWRSKWTVWTFWLGVRLWATNGRCYILHSATISTLITLQNTITIWKREKKNMTRSGTAALPAHFCEEKRFFHLRYSFFRNMLLCIWLHIDIESNVLVFVLLFNELFDTIGGFGQCKTNEVK